VETAAVQKVRWRLQMVRELEEALRHPCLVVTQFSKLSVKDIESLRRQLQPLESRYLVAKNSLSRLALRQLKQDQLVEWVGGQIGFVVGEKDPIAISKILVKFAKDHESLKLKGGFLEGELVTEEAIRSLASLLSREALLGKAVFMMQSPIGRLQGVLCGTLRKLLVALQEISKQKEAPPSS
jgi:large subunit ribosomal protein L10